MASGPSWWRRPSTRTSIQSAGAPISPATSQRSRQSTSCFASAAASSGPASATAYRDRGSQSWSRSPAQSGMRNEKTSGWPIRKKRSARCGASADEKQTLQ